MQQDRILVDSATAGHAFSGFRNRVPRSRGVWSSLESRLEDVTCYNLLARSRAGGKLIVKDKPSMTQLADIGGPSLVLCMFHGCGSPCISLHMSAC